MFTYFGKTFSLPVTMIEGGLDNLDKVDAGDVDAEEPLEVVDKMGGEGVDRNEGGVLVVNVDGEDGVADGAPDDVVRDVVVVGGVMTEEKLDGVAIGMSLTLAVTLGACKIRIGINHHYELRTLHQRSVNKLTSTNHFDELPTYVVFEHNKTHLQNTRMNH